MRQPLLALLAKEPAHGYELKLALEQTFGQAYPSPNIGQIYVTLKRLEQDGLVRSQDVEQTTRPNKRVYELTAAGREALRAWVDEPSDGPRIRDEFFIKLILAPMAGLADRMALMNNQRRHYLGIMRNLTELHGRHRSGGHHRPAADRGRHPAPAGGPRLAGTMPGGTRVSRVLARGTAPGPGQNIAI